MAQTLTDIQATEAWEDVTTDNPSMSGVSAFIQNKGPDVVFVCWQPNGTEPAGTGNGEALQPGDMTLGTAANILISSAGFARCAIGLNDA